MNKEECLEITKDFLRYFCYLGCPIFLFFYIMLIIDHRNLKNQSFTNTLNCIEEKQKKFYEGESLGWKQAKEKFYEQGIKDTLDMAARENHGWYEVDPVTGKIKFNWLKIKIVPANPLPCDEEGVIMPKAIP